MLAEDVDQAKRLHVWENVKKSYIILLEIQKKIYQS